MRCLPGMQAKGGGTIVDIGSVNGLAALRRSGLQRRQGRHDLAHPVAGDGVRPLRHPRRTSFCPGTVRTPVWEHRVDRDPTILETLRRSGIRSAASSSRSTSRRAVAFLASDAAAAITGVVAAGRLRAHRRQHRHDARADAREVLRRRAWTGCASASSGSAGSARSTARRSSACPISNLPRSARGRRTALAEHGREVRRQEDLHRLPRHARRSGHRCRVDRHHVGPAHRPDDRRARRPASTSSSRSRWPRTVADCDTIIAAAAKAKGILQIGHICRFNPRYRMAKQAIDAGRIGKIVALQFAPQHSGRLDADDPQQDRADRRRRHPRHRPDAVVHRRPRRLAPMPRRSSVRGLKHPDIGQTMYRFARRRHGDARDGLVHAGEDALRHRRAHVDHRHRGHHPHPGHLPQSRHRRRPTSCTAPTRPTGRCSTACAAGRCATSSPISPTAR